MTAQPNDAAVEAVARAIWNAVHETVGTRWDDHGVDSAGPSILERRNTYIGARAAIAAMQAIVQPVWRPISEAPRDGTEVLALVSYQRKHHHLVGCFTLDGGFRSWPSRYRYHPTHFMPLPLSPVTP